MPLILTKDAGAKTMPATMTIAEPQLQVTEEQLTAQMMPGSSLNVPFVAGALSAFLAHERAGAALYRTAELNSANPMLTSRYKEFGRETEEHIAIYEALITALGGDPGYVSPVARMTEQLGSKLLEGPVMLAGSVDEMTLDTAFLEAVVMAEYKCRANWQLLAALGEDMPAGEARQAVRDAVARVEPEEDEHLEWASSTWQKLATTQAKHSLMAKAGQVVEGVVGKVKDVLS
jgi:hypothetical protein